MISDMQVSDKYYTIEEYEINAKTYMIPHHQLRGCEKYFERKIPAQIEGYKQRKFYTNQELKSMQSKLTCGIKKKDYKKAQVEAIQEKVVVQQPKAEEIVQQKVIRPPLAEEGPTHFINIPVSNQLRQMHQNAIQPTIAEDTLPLESLHINLLSFRLKKQEDLDKWASILKDIKKKKVSIKGMGMIGQKDRFARRIYLNVEGIDDIVDTIIGKAVDRKLIEESQLAKVKFDKKSQTYKSEKPHVTILKTKGKDLVDAKQYLSTFKSLSIGPFPVS